MNRSPRLKLIHQCAELLRDLRGFFDSRGFLEVQPPCLSRDCIVDAYIDPIGVAANQFGLSLEIPERFFLQTSPELAMKRMLAAGAPSIYSMGPVFRAGEQGDLHNIEFTMLEWYEVDAEMDGCIALLGELAAAMLGRSGWEVRSYRQVFHDSLGFDPIDSNLETIRKQVALIDASLLSSIGDDRDMLLDVLVSQRMQATLGVEKPLIVKNYPLSQAALARQSADDPQCAARFELFVDGIELANGYDELRDVDELLARARRSNEKRVQAGRAPLPVESSLIAAMRADFPVCSGVALGVDRLLMVRTGEKSLENVMPFQIGTA